MAGEQIKLLRVGSGYVAGYKKVKSTYTDANGEYEIDKLGLRTYYVDHNRVTPLYEIGTNVNGEFVPPGLSQVKIKKGKH